MSSCVLFASICPRFPFPCIVYFSYLLYDRILLSALMTSPLRAALDFKSGPDDSVYQRQDARPHRLFRT